MTKGSTSMYLLEYVKYYQAFVRIVLILRSLALKYFFFWPRIRKICVANFATLAILVKHVVCFLFVLFLGCCAVKLCCIIKHLLSVKHTSAEWLDSSASAWVHQAR